MADRLNVHERQVVEGVREDGAWTDGLDPDTTADILVSIIDRLLAEDTPEGNQP